MAILGGKEMSSVAPALKLFGILFILTGLIYPLSVMILATTAFPHQAHGSLLYREDGTPIGSELIGQNFTLPRYFQSRPSETSGSPYNAAQSGGSNLGPTNPVLLERVAMRIRSLEDFGIVGPIPSDLVTASASGLDPHLSQDAALLQVSVIARARGMSEEELRDLVIAETVWNPFPFAQPYVNILELNRALDDRVGGGP
jgi:K+-transporting ATPase ATPase C chain